MAVIDFILFRLTDKQIAVFWSKTKLNAITGCLEWQANKHSAGYGYLHINSRSILAHRLAYYLYYGIDPGDLCVLHKCDNPPCILKEHLFLGTLADNVADKVKKGRQPKGDQSVARKYPELLPRGDDHWTRKYPERLRRGDRNVARLYPEIIRRGEANNLSKLDNEKVKEIRRRYNAGTDKIDSLSKEFKVAFNTIWRVVTFQTWKHLLD